MASPYPFREKALKVLVVDDDEPIRILMNVLLERQDIAVETVGDGDAALRRIFRESYDAIVLDLMLPCINGFEVIRELKSRRPDLLERVIVLTAASDLMLNDFKDGDGRLVRRVIRKPFEVSDFLDEILTCLPRMAQKYAH